MTINERFTAMLFRFGWNESYSACVLPPLRAIRVLKPSRNRRTPMLRLRPLPFAGVEPADEPGGEGEHGEAEEQQGQAGG